MNYTCIYTLYYSNSLVLNLWCGALAVAVTMLIVYVGMHTLTDKHFVRERGGACTVLHPAPDFWLARQCIPITLLFYAHTT